MAEQDQKTSAKASVSSRSAPEAGKPRLKKDTIAQLRVIISPNIEEQHYAARGDREARTVYNQRAMVLGAATDLPFTVTSWEKDQIYHGGGLYTFTNQHIRLGKSGRLELDPFCRFSKLGELSDDHREKLQPTETELDDILAV